MTQAQDFQNVRQRWFAYNLNRTGTEKYQAGKFRYDGPIFYIEASPSQRLMQSKRGIWVAMCRYGHGIVPTWAKDKVATVVVPDIAVFSTYSGDWYDDPDDIHNRMKYIMLMRINALLDDLDSTMAKQFEHPSHSVSYSTTLDRHYQQWADYDHQFLLGWGTLPQSFKDRLQAIVHKKQAQWRDPAAVAKRERQAARKSAKKALGLL